MFGMLTVYRTGQATDRARREEFIACKRAEHMRDELKQDYERLEQVLAHIAPKGVASMLVKRVNADGAPRLNRARSVHRLEATRRTLEGTLNGSLCRSRDALADLYRENMMTLPMTSAQTSNSACFEFRSTLAEAGQREVVARLSAVQAFAAKLLGDGYGELQLVKASSNTLVVATSAGCDDPRVLLSFVCRMSESLRGMEGVQHRAVVSRGSVVGCVLGSRSVSFEYYGAGVATGQRLLREVPWGHTVALSGVLRCAMIAPHTVRWTMNCCNQTKRYG